MDERTMKILKNHLLNKIDRLSIDESQRVFANKKSLDAFITQTLHQVTNTLSLPGTIIQTLTNQITSIPAQPPLIPIIDRISGCPVIEVIINKTPFPMMLDTGASVSVLTPETRNRLNLQQTGLMKIEDASGNRFNRPTVNISSITTGDISKRNLTAAVSPSSFNLLGNNFFNDYIITITRDHIKFSVN